MSAGLKTVYTNVDNLSPFYAAGGSIASISANGKVFASTVADQVNILSVSVEEGNSRSKPVLKLLEKIENEDEQEITALQVTHDGKYLCYVNQAQLVTIYDISNTKIIKSFKVSSPCYVMCNDENSSNLLAIGGTDGSIIIYDIKNGYTTHSFKGHGGIISSLKIYGELEDLENWLLISGDTNGAVKVWDLVKRKCLHTLQEHTSPVRGLDIVRLDDTGNFKVLSGGRDDILNVYRLFNGKNKKKTLKLENTLPVHQQVEACGFLSADVCYCAGGDALFQLVDLQKMSIFKKTAPLIEELFIVGVLPILNKTQLYLVLSDQTLFNINVEDFASTENGETQKELIGSSEETYIPISFKIAGNHGTIADMRLVGPNLDKLALATNSPTLRVVPYETNKYEVEMYEGHKDLLNSLDATEDGLWIATASKDHVAILWKYSSDTDEFEPYCKFVGHSASISAIALPNVSQHQDSKQPPNFVITASNDLTIKKWKVPSISTSSNGNIHEVKTSVYTRKAHDKDINAIDVSPNDSIFATASYDKTCKIWSVEDGELVATLTGHKRGLWDVSFCQFDKLLSTTSGDKTIKIWSLENFRILKTLEGHTNAVQRSFFINKNKQIVSSGADGLIKIWSLEDDGECLKTLDAHNNRIWSILGKNDGEEIISADADGFIQFWRDNSEQEIQQNLEKQKQKVEQEQSLQNFLRNGDWINAFLLAMQLDHPMRLYNVLNQSLKLNDGQGDFIFNEELDGAIGMLEDDQILRLMKRCRDWNTNAKSHLIANKVIKCITKSYNISKLSEIPGIISVINSIIPYTQRHYSRVDNLVEQSYILDYSLIEMDNLF